MKIYGYWHIWATTIWYTIITDQLRILLTSGLYDECEEIRIGFIGTAEDKALFDKLFTSIYPKLKVRFYSTDPSLYEFPTLKLIENDSSDYVGFYFHTKGVTRPFEPIISHWRAWLNESVINLWRGHYKNVCDEYDASSVNFLRSPDHFSGNFYWFNRDYIFKLPKIDSLDKNNRYQAEQWVCMCDDKHIFSKEFKEPGRDVFTIKYKP
jgi:hypothetical protein